jgi:hypothetical protein
MLRPIHVGTQRYIVVVLIILGNELLLLEVAGATADELAESESHGAFECVVSFVC